MINRDSIHSLSRKINKVPRFTKLGVLAVILLYLGVAGVASFTTPWWPGRGDTPPHVDYIWRIYNGDIPKSTDGIRYPGFTNDLTNRGRYNKQTAAANPPLFYLIHAPFEGYLLDSGHWRAAIALGRVINIIFGVLCVFALALAGWLFGGKRKELFAVAIPALSVLTYRFTILNLDFALDALLVLFTTLSIITTYMVIKKGAEMRYILALTTLSVLGMSTKASYLVIAAACLFVITFTNILSGKKRLANRFFNGLAPVVIVGSITLIATGWFYYLWNYRYSGNFFNPFTEHLGVGRPYKSFSTVVTSPELWGLFYASYARMTQISIFMTCTASMGYLLMKRSIFTHLIKDKQHMLAFLLMFLITLGVFITQISIAVGFGPYNFRYMLPAILPLSLFLAFGLLEFKRARGQLVFLFVIGMAISTIDIIPKSPTLRGALPAIRGANGTIGKINYAINSNGIPCILTVMLFMFLAIGAVLLSLSLFELTNYKQTSGK